MFHRFLTRLLLPRLGLVFAANLLVASTIHAAPNDPPPKEPVPPTLFPGPVVPVRDPAAIAALMQRVADFQLAWPDPRPTHHWTRATGYLGLLSASRVTGNPAYEKALLALAEDYKWRLGPVRYHADDHIVGQTYLALNELHPDPARIAPLRATFDAILAEPKSSSLAHSGPTRSDRWSWCDALFMAPPTWAGLSIATGDPRYLEFMLREWRVADDYLYDPVERLYFRDDRYFKVPDRNGKKLFWGRGNGWVLGAYARVLPLIPADHPARPALVARFREFAARVVELQSPDGLWRTSMLHPEGYDFGETSGSALFCYGLAWGVNSGLLDRAAFAPAALRSWDALAAHVMPDGRLIHVQPVGHRPFRFDLDTYEVYGSGALLLAGEQIHRLVSTPPPAPVVAAPAAAAPVSLDWWREARLGLFIHWGVYSLAAGEWKGEKTSSIAPWKGRPFSEFLMLQGRIPIADYSVFARDFNPVRFDADTWARTAREAGLRYLVFTAKHHDGFAMYHSASSPYNIVDHTAFKRDPLRELADACARHDLKLGIYYSLGRDWHDPDVATNWPTRGGRSNTWDYPDEDAKVFNRYFKRKVLPQVRELLTGYGPVGVLWFDTPELISKAESQELLALVRELQPACIVNDRIGNRLGDFTTSEQKIPDDANLRPWETCLTLGRNWGYNRYDDAWKSPETVVRLLTDTVAKGGNFLLNVGPRPEGDFPAESLPRLAALGRWLEVNSAAIHGTRPWLNHSESAAPATVANNAAAKPAMDADTIHDATPKGLEPDLRFTRDASGAIYLIARSWHAPVVIASTLGLKSPGAPRLASVSLLGSPSELAWKQTDESLEITFPATRPGEIPVWVFKLTPAPAASAATAASPSAS